MRIDQLLDIRTEKSPEGPFLLFPQSGQETPLTFEEVSVRAKKYANLFSDLGLKYNDRIAVFLPNEIDFLLAQFGCMYNGNIITLPHPQSTASELEHTLNLSTPKLLVTNSDKFDVASEAVEGTSVEKILTTDPHNKKSSLSELASAYKPTLSERHEDADQIGLHLYTSGTTGSPKGVAQSHRSWISSGFNTQKWCEFTPQDTLMTVYPLSHGNAQIQTTMAGLAGGSQLVVLNDYSTSSWLDWCREYNVTEFKASQSIFRMLYNMDEAPDDDENSVRLAMGGGAPTNLIHSFEERFGLRYLEVYSLTEAPSLCITPTDPNQRRLAGVGYPPAEKAVRIVDDSGNEVNPGDHGEIIVKGPDVMDEYVNNPEATSDALQDGWLYTGDIGKVDSDGYVYFVDRKDDAIRKKGENVSSAEVEMVITEMEEIIQVAAIGIPHEIYGEEIMAVIQPKEEKPSPESVIDQCIGRISRFKIPRYVAYVDEFPLTSTGKIQKEKLRDLGADYDITEKSDMADYIDEVHESSET